MLGKTNVKIIKAKPTLGSKWQKSVTTPTMYKCIDIMNNRMTAVGWGGAYYSDDGGITFLQASSTGFDDVEYNDGLLLSVSSYLPAGGGIWQSTNGESFNLVEDSTIWGYNDFIRGAGNQWLIGLFRRGTDGTYKATTSEMKDIPPDLSSTEQSIDYFIKALNTDPAIWAYDAGDYLVFSSPTIFRDTYFRVKARGSITDEILSYDVVKFNHLYIVGTSEGIHYTADELNFSTYADLSFTQSNISSGTIYNIHASDKTCIAVGTDIWRSTDGKTWTALGISGSTFKKICSDDNGIWVAGGNKGTLYYSNDDGVTFTKVEDLTTANINWIHYNKKFKTFVICAADGIYYSK